MDVQSLLAHPKAKSTQPTTFVFKPYRYNELEERSVGELGNLALLADVALQRIKSNYCQTIAPPNDGNQLSPESSTDSLSHNEDDESDYSPLHQFRVKPKRKRASTEQLTVLREVFKHTPFPDTQMRVQLARQLGMGARSVQIWFQNQRQIARNFTANHSDNSPAWE